MARGPQAFIWIKGPSQDNGEATFDISSNRIFSLILISFLRLRGRTNLADSRFHVIPLRVPVAPLDHTSCVRLSCYGLVHFCTSLQLSCAGDIPPGELSNNGPYSRMSGTRSHELSKSCINFLSEVSPIGRTTDDLAFDLQAPKRAPASFLSVPAYGSTALAL